MRSSIVPLTQKLKIDDRVLLADPVDAADPLLDPHRVPRQVVVDEEVAELEVAPLAAGLGADRAPGTRGRRGIWSTAAPSAAAAELAVEEVHAPAMVDSGRRA